MDNIKVTINYRGKKSSINQLTKNLRDFDFEFEKVDPTHLQMSTEYDNTTSVGRSILNDHEMLLGQLCHTTAYFGQKYGLEWEAVILYNDSGQLTEEVVTL